jgi:hypothetical protein
MNNLVCKNPGKLKTDIDQFIDFVENPALRQAQGGERDRTTKVGEGEEKRIHSSTKAKDPNINQLRMPSKYASILTCSFEKEQKIVFEG